MVKNRAAKDAARKLKASTGITYPRALERSRLNGKTPARYPSLAFGRSGDQNLAWQAAPGAVLEIYGAAGTGKSELLAVFAEQSRDVVETYVIDLVKGGAGFRGQPEIITSLEQARSLTSALEAAPRPVIILADECLRALPGQPTPAEMINTLERLAGLGAAVITTTQMPEAWSASSDRILLGRSHVEDRAAFLGLRGLALAPVPGGHYRASGASTAQTFTRLGEAGSFSALGAPAEADFFTDARPGLYLLTGGLGTGRTTTLAAVLNDVAKHHPRRITLIEQTEELTVPDDGLVTRCATGRNSMAEAITDALREVPASVTVGEIGVPETIADSLPAAVIAVGEILDADTLIRAIRAAASGHAVYATMHADSTGALKRIYDMLDDDGKAEAAILLPGALRGVLHHESLHEAGDGTRIVRTLVLPPLAD